MFGSSEVGTFHLGDEKNWEKVEGTTKLAGQSEEKGLSVNSTQRGTPLTKEEQYDIKKCKSFATPKIWSDHQLKNTIECGRVFMTQTAEWTHGGKKLILGEKRLYKGREIPFFVAEGAEECYIEIATKKITLKP